MTLNSLPILRFALVLVAALLGCGTTPEVQDTPTHPFLRLAKREMAVLVRFEEETSPSDKSHTLGELKRGLAAKYREPVSAREAAGPMERLDSVLWGTLALEGTDDVVYVTVRRSQAGWSGTADVYVLNDLRRIHTLSIPPCVSPTALAANLVEGLTGVWTDPGSEPELDPLPVADALAERDSCEHAVPIYKRFLPTDAASHTLERLQEHSHSEELFESCNHKLAIKEKIALDRSLGFSITAVGQDVDPQLVDAVRKVATSKSSQKILMAMTDKPVEFRVTPNNLTLVLRFHPERYQKAVRKRPQIERNHPVFYLDPFQPAFALLHTIREDAASKLPTFAAQKIEQLPTVLRLQKLQGGTLDIDFLVEEDRTLFTDSLHFTTEQGEAIVVESVVRGVTRSAQFVLGDPRTVRGNPTQAGLIYDFLELEELQKR
jgi:hypothetical protein